MVHGWGTLPLSALFVLHLAPRVRSDDPAQGYSLSLARLMAQGVPPPRVWKHTQVNIADRYIAVFGGITETGVSKESYVFDTSTYIWNRLNTFGSVPSPRYHHACLRYSTRWVCFGGIDASGASLNEVISLDISNITNNRWSVQYSLSCGCIPSTAPIANITQSLTVISNTDSLLIYGGSNADIMSLVQDLSFSSFIGQYTVVSRNIGMYGEWFKNRAMTVAVSEVKALPCLSCADASTAVIYGAVATYVSISYSMGVGVFGATGTLQTQTLAPAGFVQVSSSTAALLGQTHLLVGGRVSDGSLYYSFDALSPNFTSRRMSFARSDQLSLTFRPGMLVAQFAYGGREFALFTGGCKGNGASNDSSYIFSFELQTSFVQTTGVLLTRNDSTYPSLCFPTSTTIGNETYIFGGKASDIVGNVGLTNDMWLMANRVITATVSSTVTPTTSDTSTTIPTHSATRTPTSSISMTTTARVTLTSVKTAIRPPTKTFTPTLSLSPTPTTTATHTSTSTVSPSQTTLPTRSATSSPTSTPSLTLKTTILPTFESSFEMYPDYAISTVFSYFNFTVTPSAKFVGAKLFTIQLHRTAKCDSLVNNITTLQSSRSGFAYRFPNLVVEANYTLCCQADGFLIPMDRVNAPDGPYITYINETGRYNLSTDGAIGVGQYVNITILSVRVWTRPFSLVIANGDCTEQAGLVTMVPQCPDVSNCTELEVTSRKLALIQFSSNVAITNGAICITKNRNLKFAIPLASINPNVVIKVAAQLGNFLITTNWEKKFFENSVVPKADRNFSILFNYTIGIEEGSKAFLASGAQTDCSDNATIIQGNLTVANNMIEVLCNTSAQNVYLCVYDGVAFNPIMAMGGSWFITIEPALKYDVKGSASITQDTQLIVLQLVNVKGVVPNNDLVRLDVSSTCTGAVPGSNPDGEVIDSQFVVTFNGFSQRLPLILFVCYLPYGDDLNWRVILPKSTALKITSVSQGAKATSSAASAAAAISAITTGGASGLTAVTSMQVAAVVGSLSCSSPNIQSSAKGMKWLLKPMEWMGLSFGGNTDVANVIMGLLVTSAIFTVHIVICVLVMLVRGGSIWDTIPLMRMPFVEHILITIIYQGLIYSGFKVLFKANKSDIVDAEKDSPVTTTWYVVTFAITVSYLMGYLVYVTSFLVRAIKPADDRSTQEPLSKYFPVDQDEQGTFLPFAYPKWIPGFFCPNYYWSNASVKQCHGVVFTSYRDKHWHHHIIFLLYLILVAVIPSTPLQCVHKLWAIFGLSLLYSVLLVIFHPFIVTTETVLNAVLSTLTTFMVLCVILAEHDKNKLWDAVSLYVMVAMQVTILLKLVSSLIVMLLNQYRYNKHSKLLAEELARLRRRMHDTDYYDSDSSEGDWAVKRGVDFVMEEEDEYEEEEEAGDTQSDDVDTYQKKSQSVKHEAALFQDAKKATTVVPKLGGAKPKPKPVIRRAGKPGEGTDLTARKGQGRRDKHGP